MAWACWVAASCSSATLASSAAAAASCGVGEAGGAGRLQSAGEGAAAQRQSGHNSSAMQLPRAGAAGSPNLLPASPNNPCRQGRAPPPAPTSAVLAASLTEASSAVSRSSAALCCSRDASSLACRGRVGVQTVQEQGCGRGRGAGTRRRCPACWPCSRQLTHPPVLPQWPQTYHSLPHHTTRPPWHPAPPPAGWSWRPGPAWPAPAGRWRWSAGRPGRRAPCQP